MPSHTVSRRRLLKTSAASLTPFTGCLSVTPGSESPLSPSTKSSPDGIPATKTASPTDTTPTTGTDVEDGTVRIAALSVADFILYPLAGTHPHVHRRAQTQYVVVRADTSFPVETVRKRLTLELDGDSVPLAERQSVPWQHDTVDLAFAVSKTATFDDGHVLFDQTVLHTLSGSTIERLNNPPVFEVFEPSVSPSEINTGERASATVRFDLANTGESRGTFGASLTGNFTSGSNTVTVTLDAGAQREITASVTIVGEGDTATVRLDWGSDHWSASIPVVGTSTRPRHPHRRHDLVIRTTRPLSVPV